MERRLFKPVLATIVTTILAALPACTPSQEITQEARKGVASPEGSSPNLSSEQAAAALAPSAFAEQELRQVASEVITEDPSYEIDAEDVAALNEQADSMSPEALAAVRAVAGSSTPPAQ